MTASTFLADPALRPCPAAPISIAARTSRSPGGVVQDGRRLPWPKGASNGQRGDRLEWEHNDAVHGRPITGPCVSGNEWRKAAPVDERAAAVPSLCVGLEQRRKEPLAVAAFSTPGALARSRLRGFVDDGDFQDWRAASLAAGDGVWEGEAASESESEARMWGGLSGWRREESIAERTVSCGDDRETRTGFSPLRLLPLFPSAHSFLVPNPNPSPALLPWPPPTPTPPRWRGSTSSASASPPPRTSPRCFLRSHFPRVPSLQWLRLGLGFLIEVDAFFVSGFSKLQHAADYEAIIAAVKGQSVKAKQLAAQLIPRFFGSFPTLATRAMSAMFDLVEMEELAIRIQAIRGFPLLGKDTEFVSKIADILGQLLTSEENVERDAVHKALMSLIRQDVESKVVRLAFQKLMQSTNIYYFYKVVHCFRCSLFPSLTVYPLFWPDSLQPLFKHVESGSEIREKIICSLETRYIAVFPLKAELLKPQAEMERFITDLIKKSVQDVTGSEFELFMGFLRSLSIFGDSAPRESFQELIEIIQAQADLDSQFNVSDIDHIERWSSCMYMALPIFMIPEEKKLDLLKTIAASSPYAAAQDSRLLLPSVVQLLKVAYFNSDMFLSLLVVLKDVTQ
ncbi:hypothetical protein HU200_065936 [Digitaria exilis]|uniref:Uncharacterized protein n=1 Tax=Digitaria exilis TaxID=1010633 RepID=A0A834ZZ78_9POAL|nr:hypothetical protein HU200_065936 [Digitaria exilis]